jgi:hypothetical protein
VELHLRVQLALGTSTQVATVTGTLSHSGEEPRRLLVLMESACKGTRTDVTSLLCCSGQ